MQQFMDLPTLVRSIHLLAIMFFVGLTVAAMVSTTRIPLRRIRTLIPACLGLILATGVYSLVTDRRYAGLEGFFFSGLGAVALLKLLLAACLVVIWLVPAALKPKDPASATLAFGSPRLVRLIFWILALASLFGMMMRRM